LIYWFNRPFLASRRLLGLPNSSIVRQSFNEGGSTYAKALMDEKELIGAAKLWVKSLLEGEILQDFLLPVKTIDKQ
jgi:hypothetical protein